MRRTFFIIMFMVVSAACGYTQKSVDKLFEKYSGSDGFTSVTFSGNLLKFCVSDDDDKGHNPLPQKITEIRILAREDDNKEVMNFYENVMKEINQSDYEEFMRVKKSHQDMVMLVKAEGKRFRELLLVAGGDDDNVIIQIKGDMSVEEADKFSEEMKKECCSVLISGRN